MITTLLALFGAGLTSFLAPCVLPLVPGFLGALAARPPVPSAPPDAPAPLGPPPPGPLRRPRSAPGAAALFVAGFTTVFVLVGTAAGALGAAVGGRAVGRLGGLVVVVFGLVLLGLPGPLVRSWRPAPRLLPAAGPLRPLVLGAVFGTAWTPCVGPLVGAALVVAGGTGSPWRGAAALAAYGAGLGSPFVALAAGASWTTAVTRPLRRAGPLLARVAGVALVVSGTALALGRYGALVSALRP